MIAASTVKRRDGGAEPFEIGNLDNLVVGRRFGHSSAVDRFEPEGSVRRRIFERAGQPQPRIARIQPRVQARVRVVVARGLLRRRDLRVREGDPVDAFADERRRFLRCVRDEPSANLASGLDARHRRCRIEHRGERMDLAIVRHDPKYGPEVVGQCDTAERSHVARAAEVLSAR